MRDPTCSVDVLQDRLHAWAAWLASGGNGAGYPTKNVLHESWMPPTPGQTPAMTTGGASTRQERELHKIIATALSLRLQNTLVVVYVMRAGPAEQVVRLDCQASTVRARIIDAKSIISKALLR